MDCKETTEQILRFLKLKRVIYGDENVNRFLDRRKIDNPKCTEYIESLRETVFGTNKDMSNDKQEKS